MNALFAQLISLSQMSFVRQFLFMVVLAGTIALGTAGVMWSMNGTYVPLYTGLASQDSADVVSALEQSGRRYRIDSATGNVTVPADSLRQIRMQLANEGLPRSTGRGFDILNEDQGLGTSNFVEQARYNRALEQELVQTIKQIQGVRDARVHLSVPRQNSFLRDSRKPSASVMIDIAGLQRPGDTQLSGILHLVASSVAGLEAERVSIVDQRGNLLSSRSDSELASSTEAIRFTRNIEENYSERIIDLLTPIVGVGNVKAQVAAAIDFTAMETTQEVYNPENQAVRSEQLEEESADMSNTAATAEPGELSATPPPEDTGVVPQNGVDSNRQTRMSTVRNYEVDRSVSHTRSMPGVIEQLSVAVLVDLTAGTAGAAVTGESEAGAAPADAAAMQARIDRLTQLVRDAVGFNEARGDTVSVINEQFYVAESLPVEEIPIWQQAWFASALKQAGAALVVVLLIFGVLRPALKAVVTGSGAGSRQPTPALGNISSDELGEDKVHLTGDGAGQQLSAPSGNNFDNNLARAQNLVTQEPARAARMIQNWLASE